MNIIVKKANIKNSLFLSYSYDITDDGIHSSVSTSSDAAIHDDLRNAFRNLTPFFAHICEEVIDLKLIESAIKDPETHLEEKEDDPEDKVYPLLKYRVSGFSIGGKGDTDVQISGSKRLESGEIVTFTTPWIKGDSDYKFISDLNTAVDILKTEVFEYMQGKQAPKAQQFDLDLNGTADEEENFE